MSDADADASLCADSAAEKVMGDKVCVGELEFAGAADAADALSNDMPVETPVFDFVAGDSSALSAPMPADRAPAAKVMMVLDPHPGRLH